MNFRVQGVEITSSKRDAQSVNLNSLAIHGSNINKKTQNVGVQRHPSTKKQAQNSALPKSLKGKTSVIVRHLANDKSDPYLNGNLTTNPKLDSPMGRTRESGPIAKVKIYHKIPLQQSNRHQELLSAERSVGEGTLNYFKQQRPTEVVISKITGDESESSKPEIQTAIQPPPEVSQFNRQFHKQEQYKTGPDERDSSRSNLRNDIQQLQNQWNKFIAHQDSNSLNLSQQKLNQSQNIQIQNSNHPGHRLQPNQDQILQGGDVNFKDQKDDLGNKKYSKISALEKTPDDSNKKGIKQNSKLNEMTFAKNTIQSDQKFQNEDIPVVARAIQLNHTENTVIQGITNFDLGSNVGSTNQVNTKRQPHSKGLSIEKFMNPRDRSLSGGKSQLFLQQKQHTEGNIHGEATANYSSEFQVPNQDDLLKQANPKSITNTSDLTRNLINEISHDNNKKELSFKSKESPYYIENNKFHDQEMQVDFSSYEKLTAFAQSPLLTPNQVGVQSASSLENTFKDQFLPPQVIQQMEPTSMNLFKLTHEEKQQILQQMFPKMSNDAIKMIDGGQQGQRQLQKVVKKQIVVIVRAPEDFPKKELRLRGARKVEEVDQMSLMEYYLTKEDLNRLVQIQISQQNQFDGKGIVREKQITINKNYNDMLDRKQGTIHTNIRPKTTSLIEKIVDRKAKVDDNQLIQIEQFLMGLNARGQGLQTKYRLQMSQHLNLVNKNHQSSIATAPTHHGNKSEIASQDRTGDLNTFRGEISNEQLEYLKQKIRKINVDIPNIDPMVFDKFMVNMNELRGFHGIELTLKLSRQVQSLHKKARETESDQPYRSQMDKSKTHQASTKSLGIKSSVNVRGRSSVKKMMHLKNPIRSQSKNSQLRIGSILESRSQSVRKDLNLNSESRRNLNQVSAAYCDSVSHQPRQRSTLSSDQIDEPHLSSFDQPQSNIQTIQLKSAQKFILDRNSSQKQFILQPSKNIETQQTDQIVTEQDNVQNNTSSSKFTIFKTKQPTNTIQRQSLTQSNFFNNHNQNKNSHQKQSITSENRCSTVTYQIQNGRSSIVRDSPGRLSKKEYSLLGSEMTPQDKSMYGHEFFDNQRRSTQQGFAYRNFEEYHQKPILQKRNSVGVMDGRYGAQQRCESAIVLPQFGKIHIHERMEKMHPNQILTRELYHDTSKPLWIVKTNQRSSHMSISSEVQNQKGGEASEQLQYLKSQKAQKLKEIQIQEKIGKEQVSKDEQSLKEMSDFDNQITSQLGNQDVGDYGGGLPIEDGKKLKVGKRNAQTGYSFGNTAMVSQMPSDRPVQNSEVRPVSSAEVTISPKPQSRAMTSQVVKRPNAAQIQRQNPRIQMNSNIFKSFSRKGSTGSPVKPISVKEFKFHIDESQDQLKNQTILQNFSLLNQQQATHQIQILSNTDDKLIQNPQQSQQPLSKSNENPLIKRDRSIPSNEDLVQYQRLADQKITIEMLIEQDAKTRHLNEKILETQSVGRKSKSKQTNGVKIGLSKIGSSGIQSMHELHLISQIKRQQDEAQAFLKNAQQYQIALHQQSINAQSGLSQLNDSQNIINLNDNINKDLMGTQHLNQNQILEINTLFGTQEQSIGSQDNIQSTQRKQDILDQQPYKDEQSIQIHTSNMPKSSSRDLLKGGGPSTISDGNHAQSSKSMDNEEKQSPSQRQSVMRSEEFEEFTVQKIQPSQQVNMSVLNYGDNSNSPSREIEAGIAFSDLKRKDTDNSQRERQPSERASRFQRSPNQNEVLESTSFNNQLIQETINRQLTQNSNIEESILDQKDHANNNHVEAKDEVLKSHASNFVMNSHITSRTFANAERDQHMRSLEQAEDIDLDMVQDSELIKQVSSNILNKSMTQQHSKQQITAENVKEEASKKAAQSSEEQKFKTSNQDSFNQSVSRKSIKLNRTGGKKLGVEISQFTVQQKELPKETQPPQIISQDELSFGEKAQNLELDSNAHSTIIHSLEHNEKKTRQMRFQRPQAKNQSQLANKPVEDYQSPDHSSNQRQVRLGDGQIVTNRVDYMTESTGDQFTSNTMIIKPAIQQKPIVKAEAKQISSKHQKQRKTSQGRDRVASQNQASNSIYKLDQNEYQNISVINSTSKKDNSSIITSSSEMRDMVRCQSFIIQAASSQKPQEKSIMINSAMQEEESFEKASEQEQFLIPDQKLADILIDHKLPSTNIVHSNTNPSMAQTKYGQMFNTIQNQQSTFSQKEQQQPKVTIKQTQSLNQSHSTDQLMNAKSFQKTKQEISQNLKVEKALISKHVRMQKQKSFQEYRSQQMLNRNMSFQARKKQLLAKNLSVMQGQFSGSFGGKKGSEDGVSGAEGVVGDEKVMSYRSKLKSFNQIKAALVSKERQDQASAGIQTVSDHRQSGDVFIIDQSPNQQIYQNIGKSQYSRITANNPLKPFMSDSADESQFTISATRINPQQRPNRSLDIDQNQMKQIAEFDRNKKQAKKSFPLVHVDEIDHKLMSQSQQNFKQQPALIPQVTESSNQEQFMAYVSKKQQPKDPKLHSKTSSQFYSNKERPSSKSSQSTSKIHIPTVQNQFLLVSKKIQPSVRPDQIMNMNINHAQSNAQQYIDLRKRSKELIVINESNHGGQRGRQQASNLVRKHDEQTLSRGYNKDLVENEAGVIKIMDPIFPQK